MKNWVCCDGEWFNLSHLVSVNLEEGGEGFWLVGTYGNGKKVVISKTFEREKECEDFACAMLMWRQ
jgi:hypothetical protein